MPKILILIGGHLWTAPRPVKEADALSGAGHEVKIFGNWLDPLGAEWDREILKTRRWTFCPVIHCAHFLQTFKARLRTRLAREVFKRSKAFFPALLGYAPQEMLALVRREKSDLTIVHMEAGLWIGAKLLEEGLQVGVDLEDWFSEDLLADARALRPCAVLKSLEARLLRESVYRVTPSHVMAEALAKTYHVPPPEVLYNSFPRQAVDGKMLDRKDPRIPSLFWFSQTLGEGRGLEVLFKSLCDIKSPVEIHLRGKCSSETRSWIFSQVPGRWKEWVFLHPPVPTSELLSRISEHDIGLALETPAIVNRDLAAPNKLFQYLQGGLAVIATATAGQKEIFTQAPHAGRLIRANDPAALAEAINDLIGSPETLQAMKAAAREAYETKFNWEKESRKLVESVKKALN